ncbi:MAG: IS66 family transposase [Balneolaceae bacterium]|nr:IS66 family transposase [Balneolaceae bacterium]
MNAALENLSKTQLITLLQAEKEATQHVEQNLQKTISSYEKRLAGKEQTERWLNQQIAQLKRMLFGQKRERFESPSQTALPFEASSGQQAKQQQALTEKITYTRQTQSRTNHKGRLPLPDHLPVEEVEIYPEGDLSGMVCIGKEITEELELAPARFYIKRYIRYKYAPKNGDGVLIGELPERVIDKGIPGPGLLATILTDKYVDHLPLYRQRQRFLREDIPVAASTLEGWAGQGMDRLQILWEHLVQDTRAQGYLQADETPIKVLDSNKQGSCHQGYYWVYHNPIGRTVLFDYQPTRGAPGPRRILEDFTGYLQTDGYGVYQKIGARSGVVHLACWAHARRQFERALDNDRARAEMALSWIQGLYAVERQARQQNLTPAQRKELRLQHSLPIINQMGKWISRELKQVLPKSRIGKAMAYSMNRWDALSCYLYDGLLEIDNNGVENAIRPVALGRKNYLFAGSQNGARRAGMIYSLLGTCKMHGVNPHQWLSHVLQNILSTKYNEVRSLYPQNFTSNM